MPNGKRSTQGRAAALPGSHERVARCSGCERWLVVNRETFNVKRGAPGGIQPWCRECDTAQKSEGPKGWARFLKTLEKDDPSSVRLWTRESYIAFMSASGPNGWECFYCGGDVREWGQGYWVDRKKNTRGYLPSNCLTCCTPCNFEKRNKSHVNYLATVGATVSQHGGRGQVEWTEVSESYRRVEPPDLSRWQRDVQPTLFGEAPRVDTRWRGHRRGQEDAAE